MDSKLYKNTEKAKALAKSNVSERSKSKIKNDIKLLSSIETKSKNKTKQKTVCVICFIMFNLCSPFYRFVGGGNNIKRMNDVVESSSEN